jgi:plasmid stabilization system protein ParE
MRFDVRLTQLAQKDILDAAEWYSTIQPDLARRFSTEVQTAINKIAVNPRLYPIKMGSARLVPLSHFPYNLYFRLERVRVLVFACLPPLQWRGV